MKGIVYDSLTKKPLAADFQLIDLSNDKVYKRAIANSGNGEFIVALPSNKSFALIAEHDGYFFYSKNYSADKLVANKDGFYVNVPMLPYGKDSKFVLENIFFDVDKSVLKPESITELNKLKTLLSNNLTLKIELGGHTDSDGDDKHNMILSDNRAKAVKDWLIDNGIDAARLSHKGYGETQPIVENDTKEHKAQNRRTEVKIK
jgi:outer membrane protein OmpA-like peptidoglycan-associated protein